MRSRLYQHSISAILSNQHSSGVYGASPSFAPYRYSWFRDGVFIAYAMDLVSEHENARRSHEWAIPVVLGHESKISPSLENAQRAVAPAGNGCFHSRFTLKEWRRKTNGLTTNQADLLEQVPLNLNELSYYQVWLERCAHIATSLLWSHAKYLIVCQALQAWLSDSRQKGL